MREICQVTNYIEKNNCFNVAYLKKNNHFNENEAIKHLKEIISAF